MLELDSGAPDFELTDQDGERVALSDYAGQRVVVYFYPRANTEGCTVEACGFRDRWDEYGERDVAVLGISDDDVEDLDAFATEHDLPFHLLSDPEGEVSVLYESYGEKNMFGNTFDGVFRNTYVVGPDGQIELAYEGVDPEGHADEILADLDDLE
jgi:peroxiredoxin Q/BCP